MRHFTADPHFGHERAIEFVPRPFNSTPEMDAAIIDCWNTHVDREDHLVIAGDVSFTSIEEWNKTRAKIRCRNIWLIWGNHDRLGYGDAVSETRESHYFNLSRSELYVHHFPHCFWPRSHHGSLHVYGHCHAAREEWMDKVMPGRRSLDVGVDNAFRLLGEHRPFTEDEIQDILLSRPGHHHVDEVENPFSEAWRKELTLLRN